MSRRDECILVFSSHENSVLITGNRDIEGHRGLYTKCGGRKKAPNPQPGEGA